MVLIGICAYATLGALLVVLHFTGKDTPPPIEETEGK